MFDFGVLIRGLKNALPSIPWS